MHNNIITTKNRIRELCNENGVSMKRLADYLDVSVSTLSAWANGKRPPFDSMVWKTIADAFDKRVDYVMGLDRIDPEHY